MGIRKSKETGHMVAQCDKCFDVVEFEELDGSDPDHWAEVRGHLDMDGWKAKKVDGKWTNICVDCV